VDAKKALRRIAKAAKAAKKSTIKTQGREDNAKDGYMKSSREVAAGSFIDD
jgi:hypothetical protein